MSDNVERTDDSRSYWLRSNSGNESSASDLAISISRQYCCILRLGLPSRVVLAHLGLNSDVGVWLKIDETILTFIIELELVFLQLQEILLKLCAHGVQHLYFVTNLRDIVVDEGLFNVS